jgi:Uma2 family endonuclease
MRRKRRKDERAMVLLQVPTSAKVSKSRAKEIESLEDIWADLDDRNLRPEIVHGHLVLKPMPTKNHNKVIDRIMDQLHQVKIQNGWVFYTNWYVHIPPFRGDRRAPDLIVGPEDPPLYDNDENQVYGHGIVLAVEVVSASSIEDDYGHKPGEYAKAGVPLYLIADPLQEPCRVAILAEPAPVDPDGDAYDYQREIQVKAGEPLELPPPFGITLDTAALFR